MSSKPSKDVPGETREGSAHDSVIYIIKSFAAHQSLECSAIALPISPLLSHGLAWDLGLGESPPAIPSSIEVAGVLLVLSVRLNSCSMTWSSGSNHVGILSFVSLESVFGPTPLL